MFNLYKPINVYKNEFTGIYIKIKLNINERGKMCLKCLLVIYNIFDSLLKSGLPLVIYPY